MDGGIFLGRVFCLYVWPLGVYGSLDAKAMRIRWDVGYVANKSDLKSLLEQLGQ